jgi:hypothetical protein
MNLKYKADIGLFEALVNASWPISDTSSFRKEEAMGCENCGIGRPEGVSVYCFKYKKTMSPEDGNSCMDFVEKVYDGNEPLDPETLLFMIEQDKQSRKISGSRPFHI